jgi:putative NADH-flavin reductase
MRVDAPPLRLLVLGASGGVGRQLVAQAAMRGHRVTAVARRPLAVPSGVELRTGDVLDRAFLDRLVAGHDVVLSALGIRRVVPANPWSRLASPADFLAQLTPRLVDAMHRYAVPRAIVVSAAGVGVEGARLPGGVRALLNWTQVGVAYADLAAMEAVWRRSGLDVCCVRPTLLVDGPATGRAVVVDRIGARAWIRRADVAAWMLGELEVRTTTDAFPTITEGRGG